MLDLKQSIMLYVGGVLILLLQCIVQVMCVGRIDMPIVPKSHRGKAVNEVVEVNIYH
jgi:peptidoglycan biosynthesis protein MviN/MurJ (putative lipid II flippase)